MKICLIAVGSLLLGVLASGGEARFTNKPVAKRINGKVKMTFTVSAPTDVEVAMLGADGKVIRHLAAGVLGGKKAPPPPLKPGLSQSITWDGKDDLGKTASGVRVRARIGTRVKFGRLIGGDPYRIGQIMSLATDEKGRLHVSSFKGSVGQNMDVLRVFTPEGKYLRTVVPGPLTLGAKRAAHWAESKNGEFIPRNLRAQRPIFYSWSRDNKGAGIRMAGVSTKSGFLIVSGMYVYRMDVDGGNITGPTPLWSKAAKVKNPWFNDPKVALSPDGKYMYIVNVAGTKYKPKNGHADTDPKWPQGRVYRKDMSRPGSDPVKFHDLALPDWRQTPFWVPNAWNKRTAAYGLCVDGKGHLHVCDLVNGGIEEVSPAGKKLGFTPVPWPERVHVSPKTGDYYVVARTAAPKSARVFHKLLRVKGRGKGAKIVAETALKKGYGSMTALGAIGGKLVLWIGGSAGLMCLRSTGGKFQVVETGFRPESKSQLDWNRLSVDYARDEVYTSNGVNLMYRYDGKSGKGKMLKVAGKPFYGVDISVGRDGLLYARTGKSYSGPLERYTRDLKPAPFASGTHVLTKHVYSRYGMGYCEKGLGVGPGGSCYISFMYYFNKYFIAGFDPQGRPIKGKYLEGTVKSKKGNPELTSAMIAPVTSASGGVRVDLQGNYYLGMRLRPADFKPPAGFEKDRAYLTWTGSVVKFGKEGGAVLGMKRYPGKSAMPKAPRIEVMEGRAKYTLENALAIYPGMGPFSGRGYGGGGACCVCRAPRFDVDPYGRLALPNPNTCKVTIVDNAGNEIVRFGAYGNFDSKYVNPNLPEGKAGKPTVSTPDIPIAWVTGAGSSDKYYYLNDTYNRRAVRVDKLHAAEETCAIR